MQVAQMPAALGIDNNRPCSLSGVELAGDRLVRLVYVDESAGSGENGILAVAGVILDADRQFTLVEYYINQLIEKYIDRHDRPGFFFHAKEIYGGTGRVFSNREKYPLSKRCEILSEFLRIPSKFHLPVVFGFIRKERLPETASANDRHESQCTDHALAFSYCALGAEKFMRDYTSPDEVAKLIAEDSPSTKEEIAKMHSVLRGKYPSAKHYMDRRAEALNLGADFLPIKRLVDAISFEGKREALFLQIADACAVLVRLFIEGRQDISEFVRAFSPSGPERIYRDIPKLRASSGGMGEIRCWE
jgi:hypothetical protein